jgi:hypothetical protein
VASKKCPKCGEDNPAEAVMCWACYTPLSGAAGGGGVAAATMGAKVPIGGGAVGSPVISREETQKKNIDPRLIGAGAFLLVAAVVGFFVMNSMGGVTDDTTGGVGTDPTPVSQSFTNSTNTNTTVNPGTAPALPPGGSTTAPAAVVMPFSMVTPPNPEFATGTIGILVTPDKQGQAAGLARYAKDQLSRNGKWQNMQVAVFTDRQTADAFTQYQSRRRGAPLTGTEYSELASKGVWTTTPVFLESRGKQDRIYYPSKTPYGWWSGR